MKTWICLIFLFLRRFEDSLLGNPKLSRSEFSSNTELPEMTGKLQHFHFWDEKLGNFKMADLYNFFTFCSSKHGC